MVDIENEMTIVRGGATITKFEYLLERRRMEIKKGSFDILAAAAVNFASFRQFFPAKYYFVQTIKKVTLKHHLEIAIHYQSF